MKDAIQEALAKQEESRDCRVLFAVESGSRAWGFASPDSDYDVRAIYVKPLEWYLGIGEAPKDTWEAMLPGELDVSAWELRKALGQLLKSNASLLEWIGSPIVYSDSGIGAELAAFARRVFNPLHVAYHYASMFRHAIGDLTLDGTISVKKLCYTVRSGACVSWILEHETMPPTEFLEVINGIAISAETRQAINSLLEQKKVATEKMRIIPESALAPLLEDRYDQLHSVKWKTRLEPSENLRKELEKLFQGYVCG